MSDICKSSKNIKTYTLHMQHRTDHSHEWCRFPVTPDHLYVGASKRDVVGLMLKTYNRKKPITEIYRVNRSVQWAHVCQQLQIQTVTYLRLLCQFPGSVLSGDSSASSVLSVNYLPTPDDCRPFLHVPHLSLLLTPLCPWNISQNHSTTVCNFQNDTASQLLV